ncbi:hypothetical protein FISHEDRAFT_47032 [Fistulina hepatica ATCC 64428]|uniref:RNase III domain-containing protein n=1 Tax=Fistulina hepatica ATCC 64428 TaxID=1128425 RepID=A0A0D7A8E0_9AGAR|nr:hypothetical protein FISHEDRAFT_47032 [Fistulina hepatica ATCC 64428]
MTQFHCLVYPDTRLVEYENLHITHPLVEIMTRFYGSLSESDRPRVMGFIISRRRNWLEFRSSNLIYLESLMQSSVFGISQKRRDELALQSERPAEIVVLHEPSPGVDSVGKDLHEHLKALYPNDGTLSSFFELSRQVYCQLGTCGSDLAWRYFLPRMQMATESTEGTPQSLSKISSTIQSWQLTMPNLQTNSKYSGISPKLRRLVDALKSCEIYADDFRGIIFVELRIVAHVLADLLRSLSSWLCFVRPVVLVKGRHPEAAKDHQEVCRKFALGEFNLIVATKSFEDLDFPKSNVVIYFDLFDSHLSHAFARRHTQGGRSHLVFMAEEGNFVHRRILARLLEDGNGLDQWKDTVARTHEGLVPPCPLQECNGPYDSDSDEDQTESDFIQDPTTGGRIHYHEATTVLYKFAGQYGCRRSTLFSFERSIFNDDLSFKCTVHLDRVPIEDISGGCAPTMPWARRQACYLTCRRLLEMGLLDCRLFPAARQSFPPTSPLESSNDVSTRAYMRKIPEFWHSAPHGAGCDTLFPVVLLPSNSHYAPILFLTTRPLPALQPIALCVGQTLVNVSILRAAPLRLSNTQIHDLYLYTSRVVSCLLNKPVVCPEERTTFLLGPLKKWTLHDSEDISDVSGFISWEALLPAARSAFTEIPTTSKTLNSELNDAIIQDRAIEFTRRYEVKAVRYDLSIMSRPPAGSRESKYNSFLEQCQAVIKDFNGLKDMKQPLIQVKKLPVLDSCVDKMAPRVEENPSIFLLPELCRKFTIPGSIWRTAMLLPSITRRLDDFLLTKELNSLFNYSIDERLLNIALSTPSSRLPDNYERLEFIGDGFLKYMSSVYVFVDYPDAKENILSNARSELVKNKTLFENAVKLGIPSFIQASPLAVKSWRPWNFELHPPSKRNEEEAGGIETYELDTPPPAKPKKSDKEDGIVTAAEGNHKRSAASKKKKKRKSTADFVVSQRMQSLGEKTIADVVEAIIGAAYLSGGSDLALSATKRLTNLYPLVETWSDFERKSPFSSPVAAPTPLETIDELEKILGFKLPHPHLILHALTCVAGNEVKVEFQRLEFLGDAILDFVTIQYIYDRYDTAGPGDLSKLKSAIVCNSALAALCVSSGLHKFVSYEQSGISDRIHGYIDALKVMQDKEYQLAERVQRPPGQYWLDIEPPKILSDIVEALVGAIYIGDGLMPTNVQAFFDNVLRPFIEKHIRLETLQEHPSSRLLELCRHLGCECVAIENRHEC